MRPSLSITLLISSVFSAMSTTTAAAAAVVPEITTLTHSLSAYNTQQSPPHSFPFDLKIPSGTDLWRKPPAVFSANQPTFYTSLKLSSFASATVKLSLNPEIIYDQAGIVLLWPGRKERWIKAGVEFVDNKLKKSVVATGVNGWSDWSVAGESDGKNVVITMEREKDKGSALNVSCDGEVMRECQWVFEDRGRLENDEKVWVGFYGARPDPQKIAKGDLVVQVTGWEVKVFGRD
ncbi:hypothetical protein FPQ18DRAFT_329521 [Pyronema domesticum]|nr:hypothetical protein FPQ18DRAFT_329521 [Pyronema domesticum]